MTKIMRKMNTELSLLKMFLYIVKTVPLGMAILLILTILSGLAPVFTSLTLVQIAKTFNFEQVTPYILLLFSIYAILYVFDELILSLKRALMKPLQYKINHKLNKNIVDKAAQFDVRYRESQEYATLLQRVQMANDPMSIMILVDEIPKNISLIITFVSVAGVVFSINTLLSLLCIAVMIPMTLLNKKSIDRLMEYNRNENVDIRRAETIKNFFFDANKVAEMKIFQCGDRFCDKWTQDYSQLCAKKIKRMMKERRIQNMIRFLSNHVLLYVILACFLLFFRNTYADIVLMVSMFTALVNVLFSLSMNLGAYHFISEYYIDYFAFMKNSRELSNTVATDMPPYITCKNVSFSYDGKTDVLKGIELCIKPGEKIAIVGKNGSGKTTLAKLILKLYRPRTGSVFCSVSPDVKGGPDLGVAYPVRSAVFQGFCKYMYSLRLNFTIGDESKYTNDTAIMEYVRKVGLNDVVTPNQLDRMIGIENDGIDFSGGQWQRISIARAMLSQDYQFVVLDEPNAALDPQAEAEIIRTFFRENKDKTCVVITHRLSSLQYADRILVMDQGHIVQQGTHDQLMREEGIYKQFLESQRAQYQ